jgi:hypothetical protein
VIGVAAASSLSEEPGIMAKVIAAVVGQFLRIPSGCAEADEQAAKAVRLAMDTVPVVIQGMVENLPVELQGTVLAAFKDKNGEIKWDYFPASEVKKGYVSIN